MPMISVIMPVYNESIEDLNASIESILNQTYKNFELIIIDDNPSSNNIKTYLLNKQKNDQRIRLIFNKKNLKLTKSENKCIKQSNGKYIARIDADDIAYNNRLERQLDFTVNNNLDIVCSNFSIINDDNKLTRETTFGNKDIINQDQIKRIMSYGNIAVGPTFFFNKKIFNKLELYREFNGEDYDLASRALVCGYKLGFQSSPLIYKKLRMNSITYQGSLPQYMAERSISKYLRKHNYQRIMPIDILNKNIKNITNTQLNNFKNYASARYNFNDNKNLFNFLKVISSILCSKIVFKRCFWSVFNKFYAKCVR